MRLVGRAVLTLVAGVGLGLIGVVLFSPSLRSCAVSLLRGGGSPPADDDDRRPNIVLRSPSGDAAPLSQAVAEGIAAAGQVSESRGF
ncbi:MAG: hypothetical protein ABR541_04640 [Candidatus Dormibacteria bacterium]